MKANVGSLLAFMLAPSQGSLSLEPLLSPIYSRHWTPKPGQLLFLMVSGSLHQSYCLHSLSPDENYMSVVLMEKALIEEVLGELLRHC